MLDREEYIEQAYFFRTMRERLAQDTAAQELLEGIGEEVLATTRLPIAIGFLAGELQLHGKLGEGMARLSHYFTPFQAFVVQKAEEDKSRLDFRIALELLEREAEYRAAETPQLAALFVFQFECIARNRLGYDHGLLAVSKDPFYSPEWSSWIARIRFELGTTDFAELVYARSQQWVEDVRKRTGQSEFVAPYPILFEQQAGRIAKANFGKDPLFMFAALQRQLGYPAVPRPEPARSRSVLDPVVDTRFQRLEARLALLEQEQKGGLDLTPFMKGPQGLESP